MPWEKQFDTAEVLDKAMLTFWERGYEATSMQDLVDRTGVNRGSLYATYGDKHALFLASLRMYDEQVRQRLLTEMESRFTPREAIRQLFLVFAESVSERGSNRGCFLTNCALELAQRDKEVGQVVAASQEDIEAFFVRLIRKGQIAGEISGELKPTQTARGLLASLIGLIVLTRSRPDKTLLHSIIDDVVRRLQ